jgi:hypothetical protein
MPFTEPRTGTLYGDDVPPPGLWEQFTSYLPGYATERSRVERLRDEGLSRRDVVEGVMTLLSVFPGRPAFRSSITGGGSRWNPRMNPNSSRDLVTTHGPAIETGDTLHRFTRGELFPSNTNTPPRPALSVVEGGASRIPEASIPSTLENIRDMVQRNNLAIVRERRTRDGTLYLSVVDPQQPRLPGRYDPVIRVPLDGHAGFFRNREEAAVLFDTGNRPMTAPRRDGRPSEASEPHPLISRDEAGRPYSDLHVLEDAVLRRLRPSPEAPPGQPSQPQGAGSGHNQYRLLSTAAPAAVVGAAAFSQPELEAAAPSRGPITGALPPRRNQSWIPWVENYEPKVQVALGDEDGGDPGPHTVSPEHIIIPPPSPDTPAHITGLLAAFREMESSGALLSRGMGGSNRVTAPPLPPLPGMPPEPSRETYDLDNRPTSEGMQGRMDLGGPGRTAVPRGSAAEPALFGGERSETADRAALTEARELATTGADPQSIWETTGWFRRPDGRWINEINDENAVVNLPRNTSGPVGLAVILQHSELYAAYPALRNIRVEFSLPLVGRMIGAAASYRNGVISLSPALLNNPAQLRSALLHEVQHSIQDREGDLSIIQNLMTSYDNNPRENEAYEVEARARQNREYNRRYPPFTTHEQYVDHLRRSGVLDLGR